MAVNDLVKELTNLPLQLAQARRDVENLNRKIKLKELKLAHVSAKSILNLKSAKDLMKMTARDLDARIEIKYYRKQRNIAKLKLDLRARIVEVDFLYDKFTATKKLVDLVTRADEEK